MGIISQVGITTYNGYSQSSRHSYLQWVQSVKSALLPREDNGSISRVGIAIERGQWVNQSCRHNYWLLRVDNGYSQSSRHNYMQWVQSVKSAQLQREDNGYNQSSQVCTHRLLRTPPLDSSSTRIVKRPTGSSTACWGYCPKRRNPFMRYSATAARKWTPPPRISVSLSTWPANGRNSSTAHGV